MRNAEKTAQYLDISREVAQALHEGKAVVALESTIISHGMPYPRNAETALLVEKTVRNAGAVPASIALMDGKIKIGLSEAEIERLARGGQDVIKCSRRDFPFVLARREVGATTVAGTMIASSLAGIRIFATGGIGGVHRYAQQSFDISADLEELSHTDVAVVCAGAKSILDLGLTKEYLETHGVPLIGFGTNELPAFYTRESGFMVDYRCDSVRELALALKTKWDLGLSGGAVIANPIPSEDAMPKEEIDAAIESALKEMKAKGIEGKETTPFLLGKIVELTDGRSLESNIKLVLNNASLAAGLAGDYAALESE